MKGRHPILVALLVGLFLYWVVQSPASAASTVREVFDVLVNFLVLVANRLVQFLDALF